MLIREATPEEAKQLGQLLMAVYSQLEGFPAREQQVGYYETMANVGDLGALPEAKLLVVVSAQSTLLGGVLYFGDMRFYSTNGIGATHTTASGMRFLVVDPRYSGRGIGRKLTQYCIDLAKHRGHTQMILHTTKAMRVAWGLYERMGFERAQGLDFTHEGLGVYGFRLIFEKAQQSLTSD